MLHIRLFGAPTLRLGDTPLTLESARAASLLAFLVLHRNDTHARRAVAFQLWPDSTDAQAQTNLRHVLHTLRHTLPDADRYIDAKSRTIRWRGDAPYWLDVAAFDAALARAANPAEELAALRQAVELYTGELLEGSYDEWLLPVREEYQRRYLAALSRLAHALEARGELTEAMLFAERLLHGDPLDEGAWRLLMRLHDARGDRARALRAYHACVTTLERELGVEPSGPTREVYAALLAREPATGPEAECRPGVAERLPLVGRGEEWARLVATWRAVETGQARCLLVSGEAGSGKTRLVEELLAWCTHQGAIAVEGRSYAAEGALAYGPVVAWLRADSLRAHRDRLDPAARGELARLLPEILAADPDLPQPPARPEDEQRHRLYSALAQALLAAGAPLLVAVDDIHWSDRETLGFLHYLLRVAPDAKLLVAATARSEDVSTRPALRDFVNALRTIDRLTEVELGPLRRDETIALAEQIAGRGLPATDADRLYTATEGNPLFVVEAVRAGWHAQPAGTTPLTPRVQAVIESRLGQLSAEARDLAGVAATIGRAFDTDVLREASGADEDELVRALDELWRRLIIREQGIDAYDFSHPLILDAAYRAAGPAQRRQLHLRVARALERLHADDPLPVSGQIAAHFDQAGAYDRAAAWYARAAEASAHVYAHEETVRLLERALALLRSHPAIPQREERELELLSALPGPLLALEGYRSDRLSTAQQRAVELADALGRELDPALLRSLGLSLLSQGDFSRSRDVALRLRARGEREGDDVLRVEGDYVLGVGAYWAGEFEAAQRAFEQVARLFRPERRLEHLVRYGQDPFLICQMRLAHTLWFRGYPATAARLRDDTLALAATIGHPYSYGVVHTFALLATIEMRDYALTRTLADWPYARPPGAGAHHLQANLALFNGFAQVLDGDIDAGIAAMQHLLDDPDRLLEAPGQRSFYARVLLEACRISGRPDIGLRATTRMLPWTHLWDSETARLRAEFATALGAPAEHVLTDLTRALDIATRQGAVLPRLRAAAELLRFHRRHGGAAEIDAAHALVAGIIAGLTEGHNTPDVVEATELVAAG